jgi:hypothetical protein
MTDAERRTAVDLVAAELGMSAAGVEAFVSLIRDGVPESDGRALLSAGDVAKQLGKSRDWVYDHAAELGATPMGDGPRPRLGFVPDRVTAYLERARQPSPVSAPPRQRRRRRGTAEEPAAVALLPIGPNPL